MRPCGGHDPVTRPRKRGVERPGTRVNGLVVEDRLGLAVQHEEHVHLVGVVVGDPRPGGLDLELERGDLRQIALDRDDAVLPLEPLALTGAVTIAIAAGRPPSGGGSKLSNPSRSPRRNAANPPLGEWKFRKQRGAVGLVAERVDDVLWNGRERPGGRAHLLQVWPEAEDQLPFEHEERVDVLAVDVRVGAALARLVSRPRHVEPVVRQEQPHGPLCPVGDRLALAGA